MKMHAPIADTRQRIPILFHVTSHDVSLGSDGERLFGQKPTVS
jgi:hypothetical protein